MDNTKKRTISMYLYGFSRILLMDRRRFFKYRKSDHRIEKEKQEVCLDKEMHESISKS
jgi:hypothetical protein